VYPTTTAMPAVGPPPRSQTSEERTHLGAVAASRPTSDLYSW
jgi:hypothetical protein